MMKSDSGKRHKPWLRRTVVLSAVLLVVAALWGLWAEQHPREERELRVQLQEQLQEQLPTAMQRPADRYGIFPRATGLNPSRSLRVLLVHGLDEPGDIWADLLPVLTAAGFDSLEFRYPNDQGIDQSTDLLAASWPDMPDDLPVVLIGHSMGGLVIRDFVTRYRYPVAEPGRPESAEVKGVILVGTPSHGSDWARLRVLLELRDQWAATRDSGFSPLSGLQDGTGAAKIDLQPNSDFLLDLNARPWPPAVEVQIIGGELSASAPALGDGVVTPESLTIAGESPPLMVAASHRGMLTRFFEDDGEPPAIPIIMTLLDALEREPSGVTPTE